MKPAFGGRRQTYPFQFSASFENSWFNSTSCACCEIRQDIKWNTIYANNDDYGSPHKGFPMDQGVPYGPNHWFEDRTESGTPPPYGHRDSIFTHGDEDIYYNDKNEEDFRNGCNYLGGDTPGAGNPIGYKGAVWYFQLRVIDVCDGGRTVATSATITINWK
jgi:hypothetical protein